MKEELNLLCESNSETISDKMIETKGLIKLGIELTDKNDSKQLVKSFGNNEEYLSYIIEKVNFKFIPIKLEDFHSIELIYNQLTGKIILDCYGECDMIRETNLKPFNFFKILYEIKAKGM